MPFIQHILKKLVLGITTLFIVGCNGQDAALEAYKKQEHRFEVRGCEFFYNEQRIELYRQLGYYEGIFGPKFIDHGNLWHLTTPIIVRDQIRSLKKKHIKDVSNILINFNTLNEDHKNYEEFKSYTRLKKGQYILIDGIPFGHNVSMGDLNQQLRNKGLKAFTGKFAGSSGIKAKGYSTCENFPQFFISYSQEGNLERFSYLIDKPKNLK